MDNYEPFADAFVDIYDEINIANRYRDIGSLAMFAMVNGWHPIKGKGILMVADDGTQINMPRSSHLKLGVYRHHAHTIIRHRRELPPGSLSGPAAAPMTVLVQMVIDKFSLDPDHARILHDAVEAMPAVTKPAPEPVVESTPKPRHDKQPTHETLPTPEPVEDVPVAAMPHIISEEPWSAHGKRRKDDNVSETYPSPAVIQRNWSNGVKTYRCAQDGCDWFHENPRSVASHFAAKHMRGQGRTPQPPMDGIDPDFESPLRKRRIAKLRGEIDGAMIAAFANGVEATPEWIATWIVDHRPDPEGLGVQHTDGEGGHHDAETGEWIPDPMTPERILEEMAALLERHTGRSKILREQIENQDAVLEQYQAERDAALARAARAEGNLHALRDLINMDEEEGA